MIKRISALALGGWRGGWEGPLSPSSLPSGPDQVHELTHPRPLPFLSNHRQQGLHLGSATNHCLHRLLRLAGADLLHLLKQEVELGDTGILWSFVCLSVTVLQFRLDTVLFSRLPSHTKIQLQAALFPHPSLPLGILL